MLQKIFKTEKDWEFFITLFVPSMWDLSLLVLIMIKASKQTFTLEVKTADINLNWILDQEFDLFTDWPCHVYSCQQLIFINWTCCHSNSGYCVSAYTRQRCSFDVRSSDWWKTELYGLHCWPPCTWSGLIWIWDTWKQGIWLKLRNKDTKGTEQSAYFTLVSTL